MQQGSGWVHANVSTDRKAKHRDSILILQVGQKTGRTGAVCTFLLLA